jgi:TetR/AcrR family tetracycline transcriptional repressor
MARTLTRDQIIGAGVTLVNEGGPDSLTMRAVAARLGCAPMSLYRHVADREQLLDLVLGEMLDEVRLTPATGEWRRDAAALARAIRMVLLRRPNLTVLLTSRAGRGRASLASLEHALRIFRTGGFGPRDAVLCNHALGNYVAGAALWEAVGLAGTTGEARADEARRAAAALANLSASDFPAIAEAAPDLFAGSADDRFEFGLDCLLEGFAARLATPPAGHA